MTLTPQPERWRPAPATGTQNMLGQVAHDGYGDPIASKMIGLVVIGRQFVLVG